MDECDQPYDLAQHCLVYGMMFLRAAEEGSTQRSRFQRAGAHLDDVLRAEREYREGRGRVMDKRLRTAHDVYLRAHEQRAVILEGSSEEPVEELTGHRDVLRRAADEGTPLPKSTVLFCGWLGDAYTQIALGRYEGDLGDD